MEARCQEQTNETNKNSLQFFKSGRHVYLKQENDILFALISIDRKYFSYLNSGTDVTVETFLLV